MGGAENLVWLLNLLLGVGAFGGTVFRTITRWKATGPLSHAILGLLLGWTLAIVLQTGAEAARGGDFNPANYAVSVLLLAQIVVIVQWTAMETLTPEEMRRRLRYYDEETPNVGEMRRLLREHDDKEAGRGKAT